jgi:hypothetical protein
VFFNADIQYFELNQKEVVQSIFEKRKPQP